MAEGTMRRHHAVRRWRSVDWPIDGSVRGKVRLQHGRHVRARDDALNEMCPRRTCRTGTEGRDGVVQYAGAEAMADQVHRPVGASLQIGLVPGTGALGPDLFAER